MKSVSEDRFLDGRVIARQPERGFRSGLDAVMLAAAIPATEGERVLELGCGAGVASICLAARVRSCMVTGIELRGDLVDIANRNAAENGLDSRVRFVGGDVFELPKAQRGIYDHVFVNPPFHGDEGESSPESARAVALQDVGRLGDWLNAGLKRVRSHGTFTAIVRADRLAESLAHLPTRGVSLFPLWPRSSEAARRVIFQVRKDSRAPLALLPGLVLHAADGSYTEAADAILRAGGSLALASRRL